MHIQLQNLRLGRALAVLDLETTGLDTRSDRIVEVAVLRIAPDGTGESFRSLIDPGLPMPPKATEVHGLTDADVAGSPTFATIAGRLQDFLEGCDLAGFGIASFDLPMLIAEFGRAGYGFGVSGRKVLDALEVYRRMEKRDLASAVRFYLDREHEGAHSAEGDVLAAIGVLDAQIGRYTLPTTPRELHRELIPVDVGRRFLRDENAEIVFAFGKHRGRRLLEIAATDPGYLDWMKGQDFLDDVKGLLGRALSRAEQSRTNGRRQPSDK